MLSQHALPSFLHFAEEMSGSKKQRIFIRFVFVVVCVERDKL